MKTNWIQLHNQVKQRYMKLAPDLWWGDDLDVRFFALKRLEDLTENFNDGYPLKVLDVGCNIGITLSFLNKKYDLYGIDVNKQCIQAARQLNPTASIFQCSMEELPYDDKYFDIIIMMNVFPGYEICISENKEENEKFKQNTFNEVKRVLKDNGTVIATTPNGEHFSYQNTSRSTIHQIERTFDDLDLMYRIFTWNKLYEGIFIKHIIKIPILRYAFHPRVLHKFKFIWEKLTNELETDKRQSKSFYMEIKKKRIKNGEPII